MDRRTKIETAILWTIIAVIIVAPWAIIKISKVKQEREERETYARIRQQVREEMAKWTPSPTLEPDKIGEGYYDVSLSDIRFLGDEYRPTSQYPYNHYLNIGIQAILRNNSDKDIVGITVEITAPPYLRSKRCYVQNWTKAGSSSWYDLTAPFKIGVGKEPITSATITIVSYRTKDGKDVECGMTYRK